MVFLNQFSFFRLLLNAMMAKGTLPAGPRSALILGEALENTGLSLCSCLPIESTRAECIHRAGGGGRGERW